MPFCPEKGITREAARAPWHTYKRLRTGKHGGMGRVPIGNLTSTQPIRQLFLWPHQIVFKGDTAAGKGIISDEALHPLPPF